MNKNENFFKFAESLKLVRKADVEKDDKNIIEEVYTDLLPSNSINIKFNLPRTSILIGRKGTGKSTIIQKSLKDILEVENTIGIYIDVKTLYDGATPILLSEDKSVTALVKGEITKYLIYKNFLKEIIDKTKNNFKDSINKKAFIGKTISIISGKEDAVNAELDLITESIDKVFMSIDAGLATLIKTSHEQSLNSDSSVGLDLSTSPSLNLEVGEKNYESFKKEFDNTIYKYLDIKNCLISNLLKIKEITGLKYLYIYLDDYSEIDEKAQEIFMDWFVAPLNNLSDDFIKFKIASYPNRFYAGRLDNQKFDEINLDFYNALSSYKDISKMEQIATNYVKRLIMNRFKVYMPKDSIKDYFDITEDNLWDLLFEVSMNNPRKIGYILSYCYETNLVYGKKITSGAISSSAIKYFDEVTRKYFESNKFVLRTFQDNASLENQKELISKIIQKQVDNKASIAKSSAKKFKISDQPTSHFFVANNLSGLLDTLELNGYITTYNKQNDKTNIPSTMFALDYGLCRKNNLIYGRPKDTELRKYYNENRFIMNLLIKEHFNNSQVIVCENGHEHPFTMLSELENFGMNCPVCARNRTFATCRVEVSSKAILDKIKSYEDISIKLDDDIQYKILDYLATAHPNSKSSSQIAQELDYNWQLVSKRAEKLEAASLIKIDDSKNNFQRKYYSITSTAYEIIVKNTAL